ILLERPEKWSEHVAHRFHQIGRVMVYAYYVAQEDLGHLETPGDRLNRRQQASSGSARFTRPDIKFEKMRRHFAGKRKVRGARLPNLSRIQGAAHGVDKIAEQ